MALASVYESYKMGNEDKAPPDILFEEYTKPTSSPVCLNCNKKLTTSSLFCDKDCETTYMIKEKIKYKLIPELEDEIHNLKQKIIPIGINYKTNLKKHELEILEKENLLLKYKRDIGDTSLPGYPGAIPIPRNKKGGKNQKTKTKKRRRWSQKYKKSINCKRPKGFSQKQHCKYGRKK